MTWLRHDRMVEELPARAPGVAVIRVWFEPGGVPSIRIRVSRTLDLVEGRFETSVATSVEEGCSIVRRWLELAAERGGDG